MLVLTLTLVAVGCGGGGKESTPIPTQEQGTPKQVIQRWIDYNNSCKWNELLALFAPGQYFATPECYKNIIQEPVIAVTSQTENTAEATVTYYATVPGSQRTAFCARFDLIKVGNQWLIGYINRDCFSSSH